MTAHRGDAESLRPLLHRDSDLRPQLQLARRADEIKQMPFSAHHFS